MSSIIIEIQEICTENQFIIEEIIPSIIIEIEEVGPKGDNGKSAYDIAVENGYVGTEEEFALMLISIKDKEDKINWDSLVRGFTERPEVLNQATYIQDGFRKLKYKYSFGILFRNVTNSGSQDGFYTDESCTDLLITKNI